ncbi:unnamed protein product [Ixodes persulcatus]
MACSLGQLLSLLDAAAAKPGLMPQDSRAESASAEWIPSHHGLTHDTAVTSAAATVPGPAVRAAAVAPGDGREMRPPPVPPRGPMCTNSTYASHLLAPCSSPSPSLSSRPLAQERGNSSSASTVEELHCSMTLLERLIRTSSIWFLPDIGRSGAVHYLQGKEVGNFIVRQSSKKGTLALSVRLPLEVGPYIEHYLIETTPEGKHRLEGSDNHFASVPVLICHYCQCCDELPVRLGLPSVLMQPSTRQELSAFSLLGQGRMCSSLLVQNIGCLRASTGHFFAFRFKTGHQGARYVSGYPACPLLACDLVGLPRSKRTEVTGADAVHALLPCFLVYPNAVTYHREIAEPAKCWNHARHDNTTTDHLSESEPFQCALFGEHARKNSWVQPIVHVRSIHTLQHTGAPDKRPILPKVLAARAITFYGSQGVKGRVRETRVLVSHSSQLLFRHPPIDSSRKPTENCFKGNDTTTHAPRDIQRNRDVGRLETSKATARLTPRGWPSRSSHRSGCFCTNFDGRGGKHMHNMFCCAVPGTETHCDISSYHSPSLSLSLRFLAGGFISSSFYMPYFIIEWSKGFLETSVAGANQTPAIGCNFACTLYITPREICAEMQTSHRETFCLLQERVFLSAPVRCSQKKRVERALWVDCCSVSDFEQSKRALSANAYQQQKHTASLRLHWSMCFLALHRHRMVLPLSAASTPDFDLVSRCRRINFSSISQCLLSPMFVEQVCGTVHGLRLLTNWIGGNQENRKTKGCPGKESVKLEAHDSIVENTKPHRKK